MSNGTDIAAEIAAALREVGEATGEGPLVVTLIKPGVNQGPEWDLRLGPPTEMEITVVSDHQFIRDISGTLIASSEHRLIVSATGPRPDKADKVRIKGRELQIINVIEVAPGGVAIYYEVALEG